MNNQPIGIFDSGIGGLTVAYAVNQLLPLEDLIYFGDTAHLPYGDKSQAAIQAYSVKICDLLIAQNCKIILIACNSASAAAYELIKEYVGSKAIILNVIDPVIDYIKNNFASNTIGLIGTKQTVYSNIYQKKIDKLDTKIILKSLATPLLAPMIEEGYFENNISQSIINTYLSDLNIADIDALILGCTHYPLIKTEIENFYNGKVQIIDGSSLVAKKLEEIINLYNLANTNTPIGNKKFFVSDYTKSFEQATKIFFKETLNLQHYPLWE